MSTKRTADDSEREVATVGKAEAEPAAPANLTTGKKGSKRGGKKADGGLKRAKNTKRQAQSPDLTTSSSSTNPTHGGSPLLTPEDKAILTKYGAEANTPWNNDSSALLLALYHENPGISVGQAQEELNNRLGYKKKQVENKLFGLKKKERNE